MLLVPVRLLAADAAVGGVPAAVVHGLLLAVDALSIQRTDQGISQFSSSGRLAMATLHVIKAKAEVSDMIYIR